jgi:predicted nucleic acid-binding protein
MRKRKIYLDTSIISHLKQEDVPDKMADTHMLWNELKNSVLYEIYISEIVFEELLANEETKQMLLLEYLAEINYHLVEINEEIRNYADKLIEIGVITRNHYLDGLHIASAVISECDYLFSWNFRHIVRVKTVNGIRTVNAMLGYRSIDIYSPSSFTETESEG